MLLFSRQTLFGDCHKTTRQSKDKIHLVTSSVQTSSSQNSMLERKKTKQIKVNLNSVLDDVDEESPAQHQGRSTHTHRVPDWLLWGVFIDGRNASLGAEAYGARYTELCNQTVLSVLSIPLDVDPLQVYLKVVQLLGPGWRNFPNPVDFEVMHCMDAVPSSYRDQILNDIPMPRFRDATVLIDGGAGGTEPFRFPNYFLAMVTKLFHQYGQELEMADSDDKKVRALVRLLRSLAFLHPLKGRNGRSRLFLLQHQLRALEIADGTFMYNNNKNIYFDPEEVWTEKLWEGIRMYNSAASLNGNPWASSVHAVKLHVSRFARPFDEALFKCWAGECKDPHCRGATLD